MGPFFTIPPSGTSIFSVLALAVVLFAILLERLNYRALFEPAYGWALVSVGVFLCQLAASIYGRTPAVSTWQDYEAGEITAFVVGALVIIIWQVWSDIARRRKERRELECKAATALGSARGGTETTDA